MDEGIGAFFVGLIIIVIFFMTWIEWSGPQITSDGMFYIKTHLKVYQLVSDKPVKILTTLSK